MRRIISFEDTCAELCRLAEHQQWSSVSSLISSQSFILGNNQSNINKGSGGSLSPLEWGVLRHVCHFQPPLDIVCQLAKIFPDELSRCDSLGMSLLHIASKSGASSAVIKFLSLKHPASAKSQDVAGKTPLHWACEKYSQKYFPGNDIGLSLGETMMEIVKVLCVAAPSSINEEDEEGINALEYAIISEIDFEVIRWMRDFSEKSWKRRKLQNERKRCYNQ